MANVRTLRDLESNNSGGPQSSAFPNAWNSNPSSRRASQAPLMDEYGFQQQQSFQFAYLGIDGERHQIPTSERPGMVSLCCLQCCPCFVPPLCSEEKKKQYISAAKTFSFVITVIQLIMLIVSFGLGGFAPPSVNPSLGPHSSALLLLGAKYVPDIQRGQVWRFVTPIFLHAGILHLLFNGFAQLRFGMSMEKKWGIIRFMLIYFGSGITGSVMSCLLSPGGISVGASGAIMGLMGAYVSDIIMTWQKTDPLSRKMNLITTVVVIVITMIFSAAPFIDAAAHFGGVLGGFLLGNAFFAWEHQQGMIKKLVPLGNLILYFAFLVIGIACTFLVLQPN